MKSVAYLSIVPTAPDHQPVQLQRPKPALLYLTAVVRKVRMPRRRLAHAGAKRVQSLNPPAAGYAAARHSKKVRNWRCQLRTGTRRRVAQAGRAVNCNPYTKKFSARREISACAAPRNPVASWFHGKPRRHASRSAQQPGWSAVHARSSTNPVLNYVSRETFACAAHCSAPQRLGGQFGNQ